jgi:hypothetical protein
MPLDGVFDPLPFAVFPLPWAGETTGPGELDPPATVATGVEPVELVDAGVAAGEDAEPAEPPGVYRGPLTAPEPVPPAGRVPARAAAVVALASVDALAAPVEEVTPLLLLGLAARTVPESDGPADVDALAAPGLVPPSTVNATRP